MRHIALTVVILIVAACSGTGDQVQAQAQAGDTVKLTYASGRIMATGTYEAGTTRRVGVWQEYFDVDGSPQQWRRSYVGGLWDEAQDWREWNVDGSVRNDVSDR